MDAIEAALAFDDELVADFLGDATGSSHTKPTPPFKRAHSLEIPDESELISEIGTISAAPSIDDLDVCCAMAHDIFEDCDIGNKSPRVEWLSPDAAYTGSVNMDAVIPVSVRPNLPDSISINAENPVGSNKSVSASPLQTHGCKRRVSRKEQIEDLRGTVSQLSQRLDSMRTTSPSHSLMASPPSSPESTAARHQVASIFARPQSLWERVAARQLKLRHEAEAENTKLKNLITLQRRSSRNIRRMLRRRIDDELMDEIHSPKRPKHNDGKKERIFDELLDGIDELYVGLDNLYAAKGMEAVPYSGRKCQIYRDAADGEAFVEFLDRNRVPFDFKRTEKAVWKFLRGRRVRDGQHMCSEEFKQTGSTSKSCVSFTCSGNGLASYAKEQRVTRKYVEETRTVFINRTLAEPTTSETWPSGLKFNETMSIVVRPGSLLASRHETTVIEIHLSTARYVEASGNAVESHWSGYLDMVAKGWDLKVSFNSQEIENLLFEEINAEKK